MQPELRAARRAILAAAPDQNPENVILDGQESGSIHCLATQTNGSRASYVGEWLSLVEHLVRDQGVGGSNPLSPTNLFKQFYCSI